MRLALQALFSTIEANEEGAARRALLERRLRASERSAGFFRRLRGVVDDDSLQAPEIFAEESFPDANVVAEYLDGQTALELTRAYEDACWESAQMLAEAGRCYDILNSDALNSVVVPKNCRRRLYYIAWEENYVADLPAKKDDAPILTSFAPVESVEAEETATLEATREEIASKAGCQPKQKREKRTKKSSKSVKSAGPAGTVGATLAVERSWGRRLKRLGARLALALSFFAAAYCGWQKLDDDKRSETFPIEAPPKLVASNDANAQNVDAETPLYPTTISSLSPEEMPIAFAEPSVLTTEPKSADDLASTLSTLSEEQEAPKLASLPNTTEKEESEANWDAPTASSERTRVGLGGSEPWGRRPPIEIPAKNNDVFTKSKLY